MNLILGLNACLLSGEQGAGSRERGLSQTAAGGQWVALAGLCVLVFLLGLALGLRLGLGGRKWKEKAES